MKVGMKRFKLEVISAYGGLSSLQKRDERGRLVETKDRVESVMLGVSMMRFYVPDQGVRLYVKGEVGWVFCDGGRCVLGCVSRFFYCVTGNVTVTNRAGF